MVVIHPSPWPPRPPPPRDPARMPAKATLIVRPNSHPFQDRNLSLDQPVKVGRAVARSRPANSNAIFDCKVLSRNHALLWYENGKFFLQDTKSSNGTFVNNQRLSQGPEESPPREVCSGDIVQFGVDVMENSRKVTHGCIVATLKLFLPDGKEAKASPSTSVTNSLNSVPTKDLYQLHQHLQEALHRESVLENKLINLQQLITNTQKASDSSWKALLDEDRLLTRLEILESQLHIYSKNFTEDKLREEVQKLYEDKNNYQNTAKESLNKALQAKIDTMKKYGDLERGLSGAERECNHLRDMNEQCQKELTLLAEKYEQEVQRVRELTEKLQETEELHKEVCDKMGQEKDELETKLQEKQKIESINSVKVKKLPIDSDDEKDKLTVCLGQNESESVEKMNELNGTVIESERVALTEDKDKKIVLKRVDAEDNILDGDDDDDEEEEDEGIYAPLEDIPTLRAKLVNTQRELRDTQGRLQNLSGELDLCKIEYKKAQESNKILSNRLTQLDAKVKEEDVVDSQPLTSGDETPRAEDLKSNEVNGYKEEINSLQELLKEAREKKNDREDEIKKYKAELEAALGNAKKLTDESNTLKQQLQSTEAAMIDKCASVGRLQEEVQRLEEYTKSVSDNLVSQHEQLQQEKSKTKKQHDLISELQKLLDEVKLERDTKEGECERQRAQHECALKRLNDRISVLTDKCNSIEKEKSHLQAEFESYKCALSSGSGEAAKMRSWEKERAKNKKELEMTRSKMVTIQENCELLKEENSMLRREVLTIQNHVAMLTHHTHAVPVSLRQIIILGIIVGALAVITCYIPFKF